ncbi:helix-turn-helix domain-containing protein [Aquimarina sp. MMG016]|uniref:helix-turn-helix domain-containing protein n=1 Tax=Aquimarina sp. MMG016 TaxID=2822690 RepID=UPI001B39FBF9|nr:helix-turn-helix domain-containing protein [Aquimarina sp. MMG016]MBQ4820771.1 AraC family transcriptional regulator [Aquimarina sp. MMG016]
MNITILDFTIIASGIMGYFISISLVTSSFYKNRANKYLAISLFLLTSLTFLGWYDIEHFVLLFLDNIMLETLFAVTFFTYFLIQIQHKYLTKRWYKLLYAPFIISVVFEISITFFHAVFDLYDPDFDDLILDIKDHGSFIYNVFLIFWGRYLVKKSNTISKEKRRWLLRLNLFMICLIIVWLLSNIELYIYDSEYATSFLWMSLSFLFWWILYYGIFKLQIIAQKDEIHQYLVSKKVNTSLPKKKINETTVSKIVTGLYRIMDEEELYKNPLLSRLDLATRLGTSEGYLSQIINQEINKSIIQFVNEYRIEAAKNLLHDPVFNKYSIEAIGLEAGFKSKSAFYNAFNTGLGMSPGAYRKLQKKS